MASAEDKPKAPDKKFEENGLDDDERDLVSRRSLIFSIYPCLKAVPVENAFHPISTVMASSLLAW